MKKTIIKSVLAVAIISLSSCSKSFLEEDYTQAILTPINDQTILNKDDLATSVKGLYSTLESGGSYGGEFFTYQELTADLGFVSEKNSGYYVGTNGGTHINVDGGAGSGLWSSFYNSIANSNFVISYDGKIPDKDDGTTSVEKLIAHAKLIRAYNYMGLLQFFSPVYGQGDQTLGVPYPTTFDIYAKLPRVSVSTLVSNIISDLNSSLAVFSDPNDLSPTEMFSNHNSFNVGAVNLLLARMYLYKKDYPNAIYYAQQVLDDPESTLLPMTSTSTTIGVNKFWTLSGEESPETLFQLEFNAQVGQTLQSYWGSIGAYKQNYISKNFWDTFPATDVRKTSWYASTGYVASLPDNPKPIDVKKYTTSARDVVQLRKSEAVFILAESQYQTSPATALATLKSWVVSYRDPQYNPTVTGSAVLGEILRQKGFEFFLEGMRFYDLKRNGLSIVKSQTVNGQPLTTIPAGDRRFIWPIPLSEMQNNPNITQAPGY